MSQSTIELEWAWSRIEAMADDALSGADLQRMQRALEQDEQLARALAAARALPDRLRRTPLPAPPAGMLRSLLAGGPGKSRAKDPRRPYSGGFAMPLLGVLSTAAIAVTFALMSGRIPDPAREAALRDFAIAMNYLRQTAIVAQDQVGRQVGHGLVVAMEISTSTLADDEEADGGNGG